MDKLSLGVVALDDNTLEVTTSRSIPYLLQVLSGVSYAPLREDFVVQQGSRYAAEAETMLFSGPFVLDSWVHGASLSLRKNPQYWNAQKVKLNRIEVPYMTTDKRALLNLYNSHEIATLALNADILLEATNHGYRIRKKPNNCASIITLNHRAERATSNKHLRKALQYAFDASMYVNKIIALPGTIPTLGVYPSYVKADGKPFADQYPSQISTPDLKKARAFLDLAKSELKELPPLVLLSRENAQRQDEYLQAAFKETLGIEVKIDRQSFKQAIARLINGDFDLAFSGFCAGTMDDPFMSVVNYTTPHPYNDGRFSNKEYDDLFELTSSTDDPERRMKAFARMQDILLEEAAIIPTHESSSIYIQVNNVRRLEYGPAPNFSWASIRQ